MTVQVVNQLRPNFRHVESYIHICIVTLQTAKNPDPYCTYFMYAVSCKVSVSNVENQGEEYDRPEPGVIRNRNIRQCEDPIHS